ncbi:hypothetical protein HU200_045685 [Digitaria exilis]|uniref:UspA domain-containing protein n=1 Tax=Digitaria exilis TaxID=1010633 RepID=A0A835EBU7_9POAL|nr:hypothetical protein HU200_045685 [Digitaria exilis]
MTRHDTRPRAKPGPLPCCPVPAESQLRLRFRANLSCSARALISSALLYLITHHRSAPAHTQHKLLLIAFEYMAEAMAAMPAAAPAAAAAAEGGPGKETENQPQQKKKTVVVVGVDDSEHSYYALEWAVRHVAAGMGDAVDLVIVHAKPSASSVVNFAAGPGIYIEHLRSHPIVFLFLDQSAMMYVEADLSKMAEAVVDRARSVCIANSVHALIEVFQGDPRFVLCNAAEKHHADLLVVGSHGYGAIKRFVLLPLCSICSFDDSSEINFVRARRALLGSVSDYCAHHTAPTPNTDCLLHYTHGLPDDIALSILDRLDVHSSMAVGELSHRWKHLPWLRSVLNLEASNFKRQDMSAFTTATKSFLATTTAVSDHLFQSVELKACDHNL